MVAISTTATCSSNMVRRGMGSKTELGCAPYFHVFNLKKESLYWVLSIVCRDTSMATVQFSSCCSCCIQSSCCYLPAVQFSHEHTLHGHWCAFTDLYHTIPYHTILRRGCGARCIPGNDCFVVDTDDFDHGYPSIPANCSMEYDEPAASITGVVMLMAMSWTASLRLIRTSQ